MSGNALRKPIIERSHYDHAHANLSLARSRLHEDAVAALAQEVLKRVAAHANFAAVEPADQVGIAVERLAKALIAADPREAFEYSLDLQDAGNATETVYLTYLSGVARLLGDWWDQGLVSFVDVTVGTSRIYSIMLAMRHHFLGHAPLADRSAFLASLPGENHTLGVTMVADLLREDGWDIVLKVGRSHDELVDLVARSPHRLIGLSCAGQHSTAALARLIVALCLCKPAAAILVSGHVVDETREIALGIGADAIAGDLASARNMLDELWANGARLHA